MSKKKYWRLFAVASVPLLLIGIITSTLLYPREARSHWLCKPFSAGGYDNCRKIDEEAWWSKVASLETSSEKLFSVGWAPWKSWEIHRVNVLALERPYNNLQVVDVLPYAGGTLEQDQFLNHLEGMVASAIFTTNTDDAIIYNEDLVITCNELNIKGDGLFQAVCGGRGWGGVFELRNINSQSYSISQLEESVNTIKSNEIFLSVLYYLFVWPVFIYGFFLATLLVVLFKRAVRYVNAD